MESITDRMIRDVHRRLAGVHPDVEPGEILEHLAWEVAGAAGDLVSPSRWVGSALVDTGICATPSEAHARVARLVASQASALGAAMAAMTWSASPGVVVEDVPSPATRVAATHRLQASMADAALPIHARLESCPVDELGQAARTMLLLALEHGDAQTVEDVTLSLVIFSGRWRDGCAGTRPRKDVPARP